MEGKNEIKLEKMGDVAIFHIKGDVTRFSKPYFEEAYEQAASAKGLLLDFETGCYFNSEGFKILIELLAHTSKQGQKVAVTGLSEHFKKLFRMVGITKFATVFGSKEEAMEYLRAP